MKKKNFKVIVSHPIQYHAVLWRNVAQLEGVDFEVLFCSDHGQKVSVDKDFGVAFKWDVPLKEGYSSRTFKNYGFGNGFFKYINPGILKVLLNSKYDVVYFHGVNHLTAYLCFWIAKARKAKTIIRNIAHHLDGSNPNGLKFFIRDLIIGSVFRKSDVCLYIGAHNKAFYKSFNVKDKQLLHAPHVVDNEFFQKRSLSKSAQYNFRSELQIKKDEVVLLFCGKLISKKQPVMLLEAYLNSTLNTKSTLLFVGDGVLRNKLENIAKTLNSAKNNKTVKFLGFKNQTELPNFYSISDILALPSYHQETWGLVINEALNYETTTIVSDNVGCGPELVVGKTGFIFERNNREDLQSAIEKLVNDKFSREKFKSNSLSIINNWGVKQYMSSIKKIINE